jgi:hypothetical protein
MLTKVLFYLTMVLFLPALGLGSLMAICIYYLNWEPSLCVAVSILMAIYFVWYAHSRATRYFKHIWWGQALGPRIFFGECFRLLASLFGPPFLAVLAYRVSLHIQAPEAHPRGPTNVEPHLYPYAIAAAVVVLGWIFMFWLVSELAQAEEEGRQGTWRGRRVSSRDWSSYED